MRIRRLAAPILFASLGIVLCGLMFRSDTAGANYQTSENFVNHFSDGSVDEHVDSFGVGAVAEDDPVESHVELRAITGIDTEADVNQPQVIDPEEWHEGVVLVVTNNNMDENGEDWSPETLIANPGPDGISLREALNSVNAFGVDPYSHETITFDPSLMGAVITITTQQAVFKDGLTIDGDIDDDGTPDIVLEGLHQQITGLWIYGSHVIVEGIHFRNFGNPEWGPNFGGESILIVNDIYAGVYHLENLVIRNNIFTNSAETGVGIELQDYSHASIRNVEITGNKFDGFFGGVGINAGQSGGASDNEISHVSIISNTFDGGGVDNSGAIGIRTAGGTGNHDSSRNLVHDIEIRGNTITGTSSIPILVDAANRLRCNDNTISELVISDNVINGSPMIMELVVVGENGVDAMGNTITDVTIVDNVLTGGGIQLVGASPFGAMSNTISNVLIERNHITGCTNAGVIAYSGGFVDMFDNVVEDVTIRNNYVGYCDGTGILLDCPNATACSHGNVIRNVDILNNTLVGNGFLYSWGGGLRIDNDHFAGAISNVVISNTILWGNRFDDALVGYFDLDQVTVAHSVISDTRFTGTAGNFYADPQFVNPAAGDYRLQASSPCVDAGDPAGALVGPLDLNRMIRLWDGDDSGSTVVDCGAWEYGSQHLQEIAVLGEGFLIPDDDRVPIPWDGTDFRSAIVAGETITRAFIIQNTGAATLTLTGASRVAITGTNAADFSVLQQPNSPIFAGGTTTFTILFDPSSKGLRRAVVSIDNDDIDENPYTFAIQGIGTKPEMEVTGNELLIADEDTTPSELDGTDFGTAILSGDFTRRWYEIWNTGTTTLTLTGNPIVIITGTHAAEFAVTVQPSSTLGIGAKAPVEIEFQPNEEGLRSAIVSIANNDDENNPYTFAIQGTGEFVPTVQFSETKYHYPESANLATITVTLDASTTETVTVDYSTEEGGTATAYHDYYPIVGTLTFAPGETLQTLEVEIIDDTVYESFGESLLIELNDATNALGAPTNTALYIVDDDNPPVVGFSTGTYDVNESDEWISIPVTLSGDTAITATVTFSTTSGSALLGVDYAGINGTLVYTPGVTSQAIEVAIIDDALWEGNESFIVTLLETEHASGTPVSVLINILDHDEAIIIDFSALTYHAEEEVGIVPITVTLSTAYELTVTVTYSTTDGTATVSLDYYPLHGTLIFAPGVTSQTFDVVIIDDAIFEDDETIILTLSGVENAVIGANNPATLIIAGDYRAYLPMMLKPDQ